MQKGFSVRMKYVFQLPAHICGLRFLKPYDVFVSYDALVRVLKTRLKKWHLRFCFVGGLMFPFSIGNGCGHFSSHFPLRVMHRLSACLHLKIFVPGCANSQAVATIQMPGAVMGEVLRRKIFSL